MTALNIKKQKTHSKMKMIKTVKEQLNLKINKKKKKKKKKIDIDSIKKS